MVKRYENGLPQHNILEHEEQFLCNHWQEGSGIFGMEVPPAGSDKITRYCKDVGIEVCHTGREPSWTKEYSHLNTYLLLVPPELIHAEWMHSLFESNLDTWVHIIPDEDLTVKWAREFRDGKVTVTDYR
jgi:hypothetical protein